MKKVNQVKNKLKSNNEWKQYKKKFEHKQMKFLFSKVMLIFNENITIDTLYEKEKAMLESEISGEITFIKVFADAEKISNQKLNWDSFARFIWYIYQTSTYWKDIKKGNKNTFTQNHNYMNSRKRDLYNEWLITIDLTKISNWKIRTLLKVVL